MLFDLGIVFLAYTAIRIYEQHCPDQKWMKSDKKRTTEPSLTKKEESPPPSKNLTITDSQEKQLHLHYMKASAVSVGLALLRDRFPLSPLATTSSLSLFTYTSLPYLRQVERSLLEKHKVDGYVLYGIADMMTFALGHYATAAFAVGLVHTAKFIISNAQDKSKTNLTNIFEQQPRTIWVLHEGQEIEIALEKVTVGEVVIVNTGEVIPVDGLVISGIASVDQHALTGESQLCEKEPGDQVFASTLVVTGRILVRVEKSGQETTMAKIGKLLDKSINFKTHQQLKGEQWADSWNLPILGLAFLSTPILGLTGPVVILNGHIAQNIRIIGPLGTLNHLNIAAHQGILVKEAQALENLKQIDTILFDKTGTLTQEQPKVGQIFVSDPNYTEKQILTYAAAAERKLAHPIAHAIVQKAHEEHLHLPTIEDAKFQVGYGITVRLENHLIQVGSARFMELENIKIPTQMAQRMESSHELGHSLIMVAVEGEVRGALEIHASLRPEISQLMKELRQRGIKQLVIVSGDHQRPTQNLAVALGMDEYFYEVLPEDKAKIVEKFKQKGKKVCFIGDGINDAIAMKSADISISLNGATTLATDVAQIIFMDGTLSHLGKLIDLSHNLDQNLRNSLVINLVPGIVIVGGAFLLHIQILTAILLGEVGLVVGLVNAMLPLRNFEVEHAHANQNFSFDEVRAWQFMILEHSTKDH